MKTWKLLLCLAVMVLLLGVGSASAEIARGTCGTCDWVIDDDGVMTISPTDGVSGTLLSRNYPDDYSWHDYRSKVKKLQFRGGTVYAGEKAALIFASMENMTEFDGANFDVSNCADMSRMFSECTALKEADLGGWDASNCASMQAMFSYCRALERVHADPGIKVGGDMSGMFIECSSLQNYDFEKWDTSRATTMGFMFSNCNSLEEMDLRNWTVSQVISMRCMFQNCSALKTVNISGWDARRCKDMGHMFVYDKNLETVIGQGMQLDAVIMVDMFYYCEKLSSIDTEKWVGVCPGEATNMFGGCKSLEVLDLNSWNLGTFRSVGALDGCDAMKKIVLSETAGQYGYANPGLVFPVAMYEIAHGDDANAYYFSDTQIPSAANAAISTAPAVYVVGHKVTYDGNGGTGDVVAQVFGWSMAKKPLRDNGYTLAGSAFTGWNTAPDGSGTAYADHQMLDYDALSGDITLYAQWAPAWGPKPTVPKTGDGDHPALWMALTVLCLAGAGVTAWMGRRKARR